MHALTQAFAFQYKIVLQLHSKQSAFLLSAPSLLALTLTPAVVAKSTLSDHTWQIWWGTVWAEAVNRWWRDWKSFPLHAGKLPSNTIEAKASRMCRWVMDAKQRYQCFHFFNTCLAVMWSHVWCDLKQTEIKRTFKLHKWLLYPNSSSNIFSILCWYLELQSPWFLSHVPPSFKKESLCTSPSSLEEVWYYTCGPISGEVIDLRSHSDQAARVSSFNLKNWE